MKQVKINQDILQAISNYLQTKPFNEVAGFLRELSQLEAVEEPDNKEEPIKEV